MRCLFVACLAVLLAVIVPTSAAIPSIDGRSDGTWNVDKMAVVLAVVSDVKPSGRTRGEFFGLLEPKATLAGDLDPSVHQTLHAIWWCRQDGYESTLFSSPKVGDLVIAVVLPPLPERVNEEIVALNRYAVPVDICRFMKHGEGIVVIKDFNDPEVGKTLKRIQEARTKPPTTQSATRPAN